jgi:RNA polymerase II subunit A small phosphatase-like protein
VRIEDVETGNAWYVKDLERLGRPLEKTIIIDNTKESFIRHPQNGILIKSFFNDSNDVELLKLIPILKKIVD